MTRQKRVTRGSGQHDPRVVFLLTRVGPAHPAHGSDTYLEDFPLYYPKDYLVLVLNNKTYQVLLWDNVQILTHRQIHIRTPASIHTHYSQAACRCGAQKLVSSCF